MTESTSKGDFVRDLGEAARQNPVSAALIGMGVLWLFTGGARRVGFDEFSSVGDAVATGRSAINSGLDSVRQGASDLGDTLGRQFRQVGDTAGEAMNSTSNAIRDAGGAAYQHASSFGLDVADSASDFARSIPDAAAGVLDTARSNLSAWFHEQPLLLGAVGIAIGAGIAASFPTSELETSYLGETSDQFKETAQEFASDHAERAKTMVASAASAAAEEARQQGLTSDGLKSAATDIAAKVKNVAVAAGDSVKDRLG